MKITKIEKQKKDKSRFSIFIDDDFAFGLNGTDLLYYKLEEGETLSLEKYNTIIEEVVFSRARDKAIRFLSYRMRSREEVYERLHMAKEDYSDETIERVIDLMAKYGYIDDHKFAISYIKDKSGINRFGSVRIKRELKEKGVSTDIINQAFFQLDIDERKIALEALEKKFKNKGITDIKEKNKAYEFLLRRGFGYEISREALELFMEQQY